MELRTGSVYTNEDRGFAEAKGEAPNWEREGRRPDLKALTLEIATVVVRNAGWHKSQRYTEERWATLRAVDDGEQCERFAT
jgi:hypothetical protein